MMSLSLSLSLHTRLRTSKALLPLSTVVTAAASNPTKDFVIFQTNAMQGRLGF
jgi:hypothetical protein